MGTIVFAWELGAGYGHMGGFLSTAQRLRDRGHTVTFLLKDLGHAETLLGRRGFTYLQCPVRWPGAHPVPPAMNYADILRHGGFAEPAGLLARAKAWRGMFACLAPDLIVFDHAPTALLAARGLGVPRALFGTGFFSPPRVSPMPTIRPWLHVPEKTLLESEAHAVAAANAVLDALDAPRLDTLADLFDVEEDFLCTFAELDHYQGRRDATYWGSRFDEAGGAEPVWPAVGEKRIFAYLRAGLGGTEALLQQLRASSYSVLAHVAGASGDFIRRFGGANLNLSPDPVNLHQAGRQCDLAVCHAGMGTVASMLLAGKPLLLLPLHVEQILVARIVASLGAGVCIPPEAKKPNYRGVLADMLGSDRYARAAEAFADKYTSFEPAEVDEKIARRCEALIGKAPNV